MAMVTTVLDLTPITELTREQFHALCDANPDLPLERSPKGELIIMSPVGGGSGNREADLITDLSNWNRQTELGYVFSSSTLFSLPGRGDRSPDAAWVRRDCWEALSEDQQEAFPPICPDFVIELRSRTDRLPPLQAKMQEYLDSGLQLGFLINRQDQQVEIYRAGQPKEVVPLPATLSGEAVLPGFTLSLT
jgi:Uma2 family endonuclease